VGSFGPFSCSFVAYMVHSSVYLLCVYSRRAIELKREAQSHTLSHVNIVKLYGMVFEPDHYGIVLEHVPHGDLDEFVFQNKVRCMLSRTVAIVYM